MNRWLVIVCVLLAIVGCRPRGILSNNEMRDVLYDLHRMDGALQVAGYHSGHGQEVSAYYQSVLDKHGITQAEFDSSLVWFTDNPQIFNKIYPRVIDRLQADVDYQDALRDEWILQRGTKKQENDQGEDVLPQKTMEKVLHEYVYGIENPWQEWKAQEFCEKNVIIFGQMKKK